MHKTGRSGYSFQLVTGMCLGSSLPTIAMAGRCSLMFALSQAAEEVRDTNQWHQVFCSGKKPRIVRPSAGTAVLQIRAGAQNAAARH